jgi:TRAP transporter TAXI family solute receptor
MREQIPISLSRGRDFRFPSWGKIVAALGLMLGIIGLATHWLIGPACPKRVVIATGSDAGAYYAFARKYQALLENEGVQLEIRQTAGSLENLDLLHDPESDVTLAIVQGGTANSNEAARETELQSLASLFLEPIWVFYRKDVSINRLADLRGKRVAVGPPGSGTRAIALELLADNGFHITEPSLDDGSV